MGWASYFRKYFVKELTSIGIETFLLAFSYMLRSDDLDEFFGRHVVHLLPTRLESEGPRGEKPAAVGSAPSRHDTSSHPVQSPEACGDRVGETAGVEKSRYHESCLISK